MRRYWIQYNRVCSGWKRVSLSARARMPADQRRWSRSSAMAAPARKSHNSSQYPPLEYASERARAAGESCASQASVAAAASNCAEAWVAGGTARAAGIWLAGPEAGGAAAPMEPKVSNRDRLDSLMNDHGSLVILGRSELRAARSEQLQAGTIQSCSLLKTRVSLLGDHSARNASTG